MRVCMRVPWAPIVHRTKLRPYHWKLGTLELTDDNKSYHCGTASCGSCRRIRRELFLGQSFDPFSILSLLPHQYIAYGHENEIEDQELRALPVSRSHISLEH